MADFLVFENISKHFDSTRAADNVSLSIQKGEFFSLLGPSGCGKTTLLRILAGFEQPDSGRVLLDGEDITALPPHKRKVNTIFQNYALFPHLSVYENIAFGLRIAKRPKQEIASETERMLRLIQMEDQAHKRPDMISGGQKQRVAIARALINKPQVLLLDEPLAALDLKLRQRMLIELDLIHDEVGITFLYVTHDQGEAMSLSDRIAVMNHGRIEQIGAPAEIYESPRSSFVAAFIGDTNFFEGEVANVPENDYSRLKIEGFPDVLCFNDKQIDKQIDKHKTKLYKRHRGVGLKQLAEEELKAAAVAKPSAKDSLEKYNIVRTKRFALKPMDEEEAIMQMGLLGHSFFMFFNAGTEEINVVYKRIDGDYGLIEPQYE